MCIVILDRGESNAMWTLSHNIKSPFPPEEYLHTCTWAYLVEYAFIHAGGGDPEQDRSD